MQFGLNASAARVFRFGERRSVDIRFDGTNVLNHVTWRREHHAGQFAVRLPTGANGMRTIQPRSIQVLKLCENARHIFGLAAGGFRATGSPQGGSNTIGVRGHGDVQHDAAACGGGRNRQVSERQARRQFKGQRFPGHEDGKPQQISVFEFQKLSNERCPLRRPPCSSDGSGGRRSAASGEAAYGD